MDSPIINSVYRTEFFSIAEACLKDNSENDFKNIIKNTEEIMGQKMSVCAIGTGTSRSMRTISSMNVGFPEELVSAIIGSSADTKAQYPVYWPETRSPQILELNNNPDSRLTGDIALYEKHSVHNIISHGMLDLGQHYASHFSFANIPEKIGSYHTTLIPKSPDRI